MKPLNLAVKTASAATALLCGASAFAAIPPPPSGIADAYLLVTNFQLLQGNDALGVSNTPLDIRDTVEFFDDGMGGLIANPGYNPNGTVILDSAQTTSETGVSLNAVSLPTQSQSAGIGGVIDNTQTITESGAGFVQGTLLTGDPTGQWAGAHSGSVGNALIPTMGDTVPVHSQVSLDSYASIGSANANQNLTVEFAVELVQSTTFEMTFDADGFLRAALGQPGVNATASYGWVATVNEVDANGNTIGDPILTWRPDGTVYPDTIVTDNGLLITEGTCVTAQDLTGTMPPPGTSTCQEFADGFALNDTVGTNGPGEDVRDAALSAFEIELTLTEGFYTFTIAHQTNANAETSIPEPTSLALMGLGLAGLGFRRNRNQ